MNGLSTLPKPKRVDGRQVMPKRESASSSRLNDQLASKWHTLQFRVARQPAERLAALRLVYRRYASSNLIEPCQLKLRVTEQHLLPSTSIFVGVADDTVCCTVSLIGDSTLGLPLESIYQREVARLRKANRKVAEVSCLAFHEAGSARTFRRAFIGLNRIMAQYAKHHGYDSLLMTCHPRHLPFYERKMRFQRIGGVKQYPQVKNHPAVASVLYLDEINAENCPFYPPTFGTPLSTSELTPSPMSAAEQRLLSIACTPSVQRSVLPLSA